MCLLSARQRSNCFSHTNTFHPYTSLGGRHHYRCPFTNENTEPGSLVTCSWSDRRWVQSQNLNRESLAPEPVLLIMTLYCLHLMTPTVHREHEFTVTQAASLTWECYGETGRVMFGKWDLITRSIVLGVGIGRSWRTPIQSRRPHPQPMHPTTLSHISSRMIQDLITFENPLEL